MLHAGRNRDCRTGSRERLQPPTFSREDEPWQSSIADIEAPDLSRFPRFGEARAPHALAGHTLFTPTGWWHTTRAAEMHISVAWGQLGPDNRGEFVGDVRSIARHKSGVVLDGAVRTYLAAVGAIAWLRE